jgi:phosphoserine phosphatase RsbU/P
MAVHFQDSAFLLQNLMERTTDNIYFKDKKSRFMMVNRSFCEWVGLSPEEIVGKTDYDLFAAEHADEAYEAEQRIMASGVPLVGVEEKETWADGRVTWVSTTKMPLTDMGGDIIGTFGLSRDITEHKEAELRAAHYAEQIRRIKEEMEEDVRMAGELQKTFFPSTYPCFPRGALREESCVQFHHHYHASGMVSGDFCSIRQLSDTHVGIFLCDVMGHGVRAALGTALICAMVEEVSPLQLEPGKYLGRMNELLLPILRQDDVFLYATACYMTLDVTTGTVKYANAGHPVPIHFCENLSDVKWLMDDPSLRGPALAIMDGAEYTTIETQLQAGDAVIMFTDGLYEVIGPGDEEFSEERLLSAARRHVDLPLPYLFPALINEACLFAENGEFDDDVCLVGFKLRKLMN